MDIAIIGGGAAGFMAAITARKTNTKANVTIFERASKVLAKVEVTGGGRCNVTNSFAAITDLKQAYPRGDKLMKRLFNVFNYKDKQTGKEPYLVYFLIYHLVIRQPLRIAGYFYF